MSIKVIVAKKILNYNWPQFSTSFKTLTLIQEGET